MKKILITGANGFAGSHLVDFLLSRNKDEKVVGLVRSRLSDKRKIAHVLEHPRFETLECDLTQPPVVEKAIGEIKPDRIFHLAAQSYVPDSWKDPHQTVETNILGAINILEAVRKTSPQTDIFVCGSAEEYGFVPVGDGPIKETRPVDPNNPYGVTKVAQELFSKVAFQSYGTKVCLVRPFAHEGPRRGKEFAASDFALQLVAIERGLRKEKVIHYGSLETVRDYIDVRDIVQMYAELMDHFAPGEVYNIASGKATTIGDLIHMFIKVSGISGIELVKNPKLTRPTQASYLVGDAAKINSCISYRPQISLEKMCTDILSYWRENFESLAYWEK